MTGQNVACPSVHLTYSTYHSSRLESSEFPIRPGTDLGDSNRVVHRQVTGFPRA